MASFPPFNINAYQPVQSIVLPQLCAAVDTIQNELTTAISGTIIGTTYYVDNSIGNDSNTGTTPATAWQTTTKVNGFAFSPGDIVLFNGSQTFSGGLQPSVGGLPAAPITFGSFGTGRATINAGTGIGFFGSNLAGYIIRDLKFVGTAVTNFNSGINFFNSLAANNMLFGVAVLNCTVSTFGETGISIGGTNSGAGFSDVIVAGCEVSGCGFSTVNPSHGHNGIQFFGAYGLLNNAPSNTNLLVTNCYVHDNLGNASASNASGTGIQFGQCSFGVISFCRCVNNGSASTTSSGPVGIIIFDSLDCRMENCTVISQGSAGGDGDGFDLDAGCVRCTMRDCYARDCVGAGLLVYQYNDPTNLLANDNSNVINCISENCATSTVISNDSTVALTNVRMSGCRMYQSNGSHAAVFLGGTNAANITGVFWGNQIVCVAQVSFIFTSANPPITVDANFYQAHQGPSFNWNGTSYDSLNEFSLGTGKETSRWFQNTTSWAQTKNGAPTASDISQGAWALIRDETNATTKIYYNNAGTLQSVALT